MNANVSRLPQRNLRARAGESSGARDFLARAQTVAAIAERFADAVDRDARFPAEAFAAIREQKLLGMLIPTELGGDGARAADVADVCAILGRACGSTGDDFRDASGQGRLSRAPRARQRLAARVPAPHRRATRCVARLLDDRGQQRRRHPLAAKRRCASTARASRCERDASCISYGAHADGHRHDGAPRRTPRRAPIRFSSRSSARTTRWSRPAPGTRSACAAPAASAIIAARRGRMPIRCCPSPTSASTTRPWRPTRISSGVRPGRASRPARAGARALSCARPRAIRAAACRRAPRI